MSSTTKRVLELIEVETGIDSSLLLSRNRTAPVADARFICWWLLKQRGHSLSSIAAIFGRDHSTVIHGVRSVNERRGASVGFRAKTERLFVRLVSENKTSSIDNLIVQVDRLRTDLMLLKGQING